MSRHRSGFRPSCKPSDPLRSTIARAWAQPRMQDVGCPPSHQACGDDPEKHLPEEVEGNIRCTGLTDTGPAI